MTETLIADADSRRLRADADRLLLRPHGAPAGGSRSWAVRRSPGRWPRCCCQQRSAAPWMPMLGTVHVLPGPAHADGEARWLAICALAGGRHRRLRGRGRSWRRERPARQGPHGCAAAWPATSSRCGPGLLRCFSTGDTVSRIVGGTADAGTAPASMVMTVTAVIPPVGSVLALGLIDPWLVVAFAAAVPALAHGPARARPRLLRRQRRLPASSGSDRGPSARHAGGSAHRRRGGNRGP